LAISTSGDYERFFEEDGVRYHHIFDPQTGRPAGPYSGVTVVAESSIWADAMSTSLFILGPERGMALARQFHAAAVWLEVRDSGLCAIPMPEITPILDLQEIPNCERP
jgi:thiamine biosynthesis lipoprotein